MLRSIQKSRSSESLHCARIATPPRSDGFGGPSHFGRLPGQTIWDVARGTGTPWDRADGAFHLRKASVGAELHGFLPFLE